MKGFVPTPDSIVDLMVAKLFRHQPPENEYEILDPGCGTGAFIEGIIRWCNKYRRPLPRIIGIEPNPRHIREARRKFAKHSSIKILQQDFLTPRRKTYDYIIGNPPYVPITELSEPERDRYRECYTTASGRFDLYLLFFEQALRCLKLGGRLVFITPEKFLYVNTARPLRSMLGGSQVQEIQLIDEETFRGLVTYPAITTVVKSSGPSSTRVVFRNGKAKTVSLTADGSSWMPILNGKTRNEGGGTLADICLRISCGVATGADSVYVVGASDLDPTLKPFAYPTIAGRRITTKEHLPAIDKVMLIPYTRRGELLPEKALGDLGAYLSLPERREKLLKRTCVARKPWYAFHESPPLPDILRPKILCKDITAKPFFVVDDKGSIVPRHSVYYMVPKDPSCVHDLADHLNSLEIGRWLRSHCQRAANGFLRLQSHILKEIPISGRLLSTSQQIQVVSFPPEPMLSEV